MHALLRHATSALSVVVGALVVAGGVAATPASAADNGGTFDITRLTTRNVVVRSNSCLDIPVTATWRTGYESTGSGDVDFDADVEVWRAGSNLGSAFVYDLADHVGETLAATSDSYFWCPFEGLGALTFGPSHVSGTVWGTWSILAQESFLDGTRATSYVRQASATGLAVAKVPGRRALRKVTVRPSFYSVDAYAWRAWKNKYVTVQRWNGRSWVSVRTVRTTSQGVGSATLPASRGQRFRAVTAAAWNTWGATSATRVAP